MLQPQVLQRRVPRRYGELPTAFDDNIVDESAPGGTRVRLAEPEGNKNWFECIAPSPLLTKLSKLKKRS